MPKMLRWINVLLITVTLLSYLSPFISPEWFWPVAILGLLFPWLVLAHIGMIVIWLLRQKRYFLYSLATLVLGSGHLAAYIGTHGSPTQAEQQAAFRVVSYNVRAFYSFEDKVGKIPLDQLKDVIRDLNADILCLQEFPNSEKAGKKISEIIRSAGKYEYSHWEKGHNQAVFSRFPLENARYFDLKDQKSLQPQAINVTIGDKRYSLYNVHLHSNQITTLADQVSEHGDLNSKETWVQVKGMFGRYRYTTQLRARQSRLLVAEVQKATNPVLICGDFNDTPLSYAYRQVSQGRQDCFRAAGKGLGITYGGKIPSLRIDYIFVPDDAVVYGSEVLRLTYSDHYPVVATVKR